MGRESRRKKATRDGFDQSRARTIEEGRLVEHKDGSATIMMTPEVHKLLLEQRQAFINKFGREPGEDDPVFFDPDAATSQPLTKAKVFAVMEEAARVTGIDLGRAIEHFFGRQELEDYRKTQ